MVWRETVKNYLRLMGFGKGRILVKYKAIKYRIFIIGKAIVLLALALYMFSCANPGAGPGGGPRDSIAPAVLSTVPNPYATNYNGRQIEINFDEYVVADNLESTMVISPPLAKKTEVRIKGKGIVIKIDEDLVPGRTYSVDFKDGIKDYNEGNVLEGFRMLFSTYDKIDTLRIKGYLLDAFTLEPVENVMVSLYSINHDSVFQTMRPDFIAKPDEYGFFLFDNLPANEEYRLFGLIDGDKDLMFSQETEKIAFIDSVISPKAKYVERIDTLFEENDTIISEGFTEFLPGPVNAYLFEHDQFNQYIDVAERDKKDHMLLTFGETLTDSFKYELVGQYADNWSYVEYGTNKDSVDFWITDTTLVNTDSLYLSVTYTATDTADRYVSLTDTLDMFFVAKENNKNNREKLDEEVNDSVKQPELYSLSTNLKSSTFDLNRELILVAPSPVRSLPKQAVDFQIQVNDSTYKAVDFNLHKLKESEREYRIDFDVEENSTYQLEVDSASVLTLTGIPNEPFQMKVESRELGYYGAVILNIEGFSGPALIQLLEDGENEKLVKQMDTVIVEGNELMLSYLSPGNYRVKLIDDRND
ncbi:MAG TPA: Ig-like domain-containing protein, partial [Prolixibacteraceae bacterium]|nr:Ig-like domain-containing protein [Prolixibacteraceae bacterium]